MDKGFIGLSLLICSIIITAIMSIALFGAYYDLAKIGLAEESISTDYENLSSGIYYGLWLANTSVTTNASLANVNGTVYTVNVEVNAGTSTITAKYNGGIPDNRAITATYNSKTITSWN